MCDTFVATPEVTADGVMLFGKNSDREPNEAQQIVLIPAAKHTPGVKVKCTYREIDQVAQTYSVLLSKPFWIWGAEMGVNDQGVAIGNEAVFSKIKASKRPALIGMDLLRLALERAATASTAVQIITELIEQYGQGGNCGYTHPFYYHNSFLIADPVEAWLLETVDRHWAAKKITGYYSISNQLTISQDFDRSSPELAPAAIAKGWCKNRADFDFARDYSDFLFTKFSYSHSRRERTMARLKSAAGQITAETCMSILRDHYPESETTYRSDRSFTGASVCMHASFGPIRISQTTGSLVAHLHPRHPTYFATATAAPCTSIFKPLWLDTPLPELERPLTGEYDANTYFWQHERFHRSVITNFQNSISRFQEVREEQEKENVARALQIAAQPQAVRVDFARECLQRAIALEQEWLARVTESQGREHQGFWHKRAWKKWNRLAKMPPTTD
ncbi:C69 family dipeptidase [candidate division KSB1 bacterium]|nr:C69 family dipeptidase [candidate division KSB1 bacterium]